MASTLHLVGEGFVQSLFRMGEMFAQTEVDKRMFRLAAQDESRHVAFGVMHMKYVIETQPERREEIHTYLDRMEGSSAPDRRRPASPAAARRARRWRSCSAAAQRDAAARGLQKLLAIRKRQVNEYMHRLDVVGLGDRRERMNRHGDDARPAEELRSSDAGTRALDGGAARFQHPRRDAPLK